MDEIQTTFINLKALIEKHLKTKENLSCLSCNDVDTLLSLWCQLSKFTWQERSKEENQVKLDYISALNDHADKIKAMLHWKLNMISNQLSENDKNPIIKQLIIEGSRSNSVLMNTDYDLLWTLIDDGVLRFDSPDTVKLLDVKCLVYFAKNKRYVTKTKNEKERDDDIEDDDSEANATMSNVERFWVNVLSVFAAFADFDRNAVLRALAAHVSPKINCIPMSVSIMESSSDNVDLIDKIIAHYKVRSDYISPLIKNRHTVGIVLENRPFNFHNYTEFKEKTIKHGFYANNISIEFPYMCYAWIDRVEIDIAEDSNKTVKSLSCSHGRDYIQRGFSVYREHNSFIARESKTHIIKCDNSGPGYYISIHVGGFSEYFCITGLRLYGRAVSFV